MPMPVLSTSEVRSMVLEGLNLSKNAAYGTFDNSPLYKIEFINDCIFQADIEVCKCIARAAGHPRRDEYGLDLPVINTPGVRVLISNSNHHFGEPVSFYITRNDDVVVVGKPAPAQKITEWSLDIAGYGGNDCVDGYYDYTDNHLIFTGKSILVRVLNVNPHVVSPPDASLYAPFENKITVYNIAMSLLLKKDPVRKADAVEFRTDADKELAMIMGSDISASVERYGQVR